MRTRTPRGAAIVIHSLDHARAALRAASTRNLPVVLLSAPGAAAYAGAPWFLRLVEMAAAEHPQARYEAVLDCGSRPGHVLAALRQGAKAVHFSGSKAAAAKLSAIAEAYGARLETGRRQALDLRGEPEPEVACQSWLEKTPVRDRHGGQRRA